MPPPCGAGACWYWPAKLYSPSVRRICSSISGGSRSGCKASPALRPKDCRPNTVSTRCSSSSSAIAGRRTTSHGSCASTWPARSSSCSRCMISTIAPVELVVEPAVEGVVVPLVGRLALGLRQRLLGLQRVVDDDDVGTPPGQHPADRGGDPAALRRRLELGHRLMPRREPGREEPLVPVAGDDAPAVARQFVGEVLGVADAEDLRARVVPETPGRKGDRGQVRLQMARRHADDQPADPAFAHRRELRRDQLDMPVHRERGARVELAERARREAREVVPQQCRALAPRGVPADDRRRRGQRGCSEAAAAAASAASAAIWRRSRATNSSTTSRSGRGQFRGLAAPPRRPSARPPSACRSASWSRADRPSAIC